MNPASWAITLYWADPLLARDFDVLTRAGRVQARAAADGADTPAAWFSRAACSYVGDDAQAVIARLACEHTAALLASEAPS